MTLQQRELVDRFFEQAVALPIEQQAVYLAANCPDPEVRAEIESLLAFVTDSPVARLKEAIVETVVDVADAALIGQRVGPYCLEARIGQGGMGTVYRANRVDGEFQQTVAIKMLRFGPADSAELRLFYRERQILAALEHPLIARLLDGGSWIPPGATERQPYIVMEYVEGLPLTAYCDRQGLNVPQRLALFRQVCDAFSYAHRALVIHRDVKPGNILVASDGTPKLLDFGIATLVDTKTRANGTLTAALWRAMTPDYASPEQVRGESISTASDVYSLGVVLYELLTGRRPHVSSENDPLGIARAVCERQVALPSVISSRELQGDLDVIVMKAMQIEPARRYGSVEQLSQDLGRYLAGYPILARPDAWTYRTAKFIRRNKIGVAAATTVVLALVAGIAVSSWQAIRAARAERAALIERDRAMAEKQRADNESATAKAVTDFLQTDLLAQAGPSTQSDRKPDPDIRVRTALERAAATVGSKFADQPLLEAKICQTIGRTYQDLGLFPEAERAYQRAIELRSRLLGAENPTTLSTMQDLGELYWLEGNYQKSSEFLEPLLETQRRVVGKEHPDTLQTMNDLATAYDEQGKYAEAQKLYEDLVEHRRRILGETDRETLNAMNNLAVLYDDQGKRAQAEALYSKVLELQKRVLGEEHPYTLTTMNNLGQLYDQMGEFARAEQLLTALTTIQQRVLGDGHPELLVSMGNLGILYTNEGKYAQAESVLSKVLRLRRLKFGDSNPRTLDAANSLGALHIFDGKYAEAEALLTRTLAIRRRVLGEEHPRTLATMRRLADLCLRLDRYDRAEALLTQVLTVRRRTLGESHTDTASVMTSLGEVALRQQKYTRAEPLLRTAWQAYQAANDQTWRGYDTESMLGASLVGQKRYAESERLILDGYQDLLRRQSTIPAPYQPAIERAEEWVVRLYRDWGKSQSAAEWRDKIQTRRRSSH
jgi:serine/threonine protein kinase/Tfp pilus assembly protein PilF